MSSIPKQLATFFAVLAVLYTGGFIAGQFIDTSHGDEEMGHEEPAGHGSGHEDASRPAAAVRGLAVASGGLRLDLRSPEMTRGRTSQLRFVIRGADGRPVTGFDLSHEKRLHLIVVRRDLTGFRHLHPRMTADGTWTTRIRLPEAGTYRVFADFVREGAATTLATDLRVDGDADLGPLPRSAQVTRTGTGYEVRRETGPVRAGLEAEIAFRVTRGGEPVVTEPYLGAGGHLVALREGDLAFLHVHPLEGGHAGAGATAFRATFPTEGRYRLFLQFKAEGRVHTAAFTQAVER